MPYKDPERYREYKRQYRKENREKELSRGREWHKKNRIRSRINGARGRAKRYGLEFNLTEEEIVCPKYCPVLGIELDYESTTIRSDNLPSLDRIDSTKGYTLDNVRVISWRANKIKQDATLSELLKLAEFAKKQALQSSDLLDQLIGDNK